MLILLLFVMQTLAVELMGKTTDFKAVPGCGLKCKVTGIESLLLDVDMDGVKNRRNRQGSLKLRVDTMSGTSVSNDLRQALKIGGKLMSRHLSGTSVSIDFCQALKIGAKLMSQWLLSLQLHKVWNENLTHEWWMKLGV